MKRIAIQFILLLFVSSFAYAQAGYLDKTFGDGGVVLANFLDVKNIAFDTEILSDGKILQCGILLDPSVLPFVVRYNKNGHLDSSFGSNGVTWYYPKWRLLANKIYTYKDGRILIVGVQNSDIYDNRAPYIIRMLPDGKIDSTFGVNGIFQESDNAFGECFVTAKIQDDGKIRVLGGSGKSNSGYRPTITLITQNGVRDPSFGKDGRRLIGSVADTGYVTDAVLDKNNNCLFALGLPSNSASDVRALRCNKDGVLDSNYGEKGIVNIPLSDQEDVMTSICILPNGKTICLVNSYVNNKYQHSLLRLTSSGKLDPSFGDYGTAGMADVINHSYFSRCNIDSNGNIIISGDRDGHPADEASSITARYLPNGMLDSSYGVSGGAIKLPIRTTKLYSIDIQSDGKYLFCGYAGQSNPEWNALLYRVNNTGASDVRRDITRPGKSQLSLHPTPATDNCTITFTLPTSSDCSLTLRDESGRAVKTFITNEFRAAGKHEDELDLRGLAAGVYFLSLEHDGKTETAKLIKQ
ncbi:MAG TPA: T9SS type A sorting domain-containing protein [Candidatus Kapabacteria bacterium]